MKKYIYQEKEYLNLYALRRAMPTVSFPKEPTNELLESLGVTVVEYEYVPTEQELLAQAKNERAQAVAKIKVVVDGMEFDGDEVAQNRIARVIIGAIANNKDLSTKQTWVLADNTIAEPTVAQLAQVLLLSGSEQTDLWTKPYTDQK